MPPKKQAAVLGGYPLDLMETNEMKQFLVQIQKELELSKEERNYYLMDRDKINSFWELTKDEIYENQGQLRMRNLELEEMKFSQGQALKFTTTVKYGHFLFEQGRDAAYYRLGMAANVRDGEEKLKDEEVFMMIHLMDTRRRMIDQEAVDYEHFIQELKTKNHIDIHKVTHLFEDKIEALVLKYQTRVKELKDEYEKEKCNAIRKLEGRKEEQLSSFRHFHRNDLNNMQMYFRDVVQKNLALIVELKVKKLEAALYEKEIADLLKGSKRENKRLHVLEKKSEDLMGDMSDYYKNKETLKDLKEILRRMLKTIEDLKFEKEVLVQNMLITEQQTKDLYDQFVKKTRKMQQKLGLKTVYFEKMLKSYKEPSEEESSKTLETPSPKTPDLKPPSPPKSPKRRKVRKRSPKKDEKKDEEKDAKAEKDEKSPKGKKGAKEKKGAKAKKVAKAKKGAKKGKKDAKADKDEKEDKDVKVKKVRKVKINQGAKGIINIGELTVKKAMKVIRTHMKPNVVVIDLDETLSEVQFSPPHRLKGPEQSQSKTQDGDKKNDLLRIF